MIVDPPQAVNAAGNDNVEWMLAQDVYNITHYEALFAPQLPDTR